MDLIVATLNLGKGTDRWVERAVLVSRDLATLNPHLVGLQEVDLRIDQGNWLCRRVNDLREYHVPEEDVYTIHHVVNPRMNVTQEALAVMTRLPVLEHTGLDYLIRERVAQRIRLQTEAGPLDFYHTHFHHVQDGPGDEMRGTQAQRLLQWMEKHDPGVPLILVGDLNATPDSTVIRRLKEYLRSAFEVVHGRDPDGTRSGGWRENAVESSGAVDYILVSPQVNVQNAMTFGERPAADDPRLYPSDHIGLAAMIRLRR